MWPFGAVLAVGFAAAVAGLTGLAWLAWALLHHPRLPRPGTIPLHDAVGVLQLVFASVAGAGALVALIVAYRRQKIAEADSAHDRTRVFNERFTAIAAQLGDGQPAVRLAGVHAMAGLADDWEANRQTCIDVLCAYLRMPYEPDPGDDALMEKQLAFRASREVRHTVIRVITAHLTDASPVSWRGCNFDFTGVVFDGGNFARAEFSGGKVSFDSARFSGGKVSFENAKFSGGWVSFDGAKFSGGAVTFWGAEFSDGGATFNEAEFSGSTVSFIGAKFSGGMVFFIGARFRGGTVFFNDAKFSGAGVALMYAEFSGGTVSFGSAQFTGGKVSFDNAKFSGGTVAFSHPGDWSRPPAFGPGFDESSPPPGVTLPAPAGPSPSPASPPG